MFVVSGKSYLKLIFLVNLFIHHGSTENSLNTSSHLSLDFGKTCTEKCREYYSRSTRTCSSNLGIKPREFPHMALLGYKDKKVTKWLCGGVLISDYFVLTAAHCLYSKDLGAVCKVRLGSLSVKSTTNHAHPMDYRVSEIFAHPDYKIRSHYNDIGLLKLTRKVNFSSRVKPACLYIDFNVTSPKLIRTGWGRVNYNGETRTQLVKAEVDYVNHETCAKSYADVSSRKLINGIIDDIQICASGEDGRDACPGDSGGPLQIKKLNTYGTVPHYMVVGITSFGKACSVEKSVGVYTRVAPYTTWIEKIVWPDHK